MRHIGTSVNGRKLRMNKCQLKKGFFVLRDCTNRADNPCSVCGRIVCPDHYQLVNGQIVCHDCHSGKKNKKTKKTPESAVWKDNEAAPYLYRSYYYNSYHPIYTGGYYDNYYDNYDYQVFNNQDPQMMEMDRDDEDTDFLDS